MAEINLEETGRGKRKRKPVLNSRFLEMNSTDDETLGREMPGAKTKLFSRTDQRSRKPVSSLPSKPTDFRRSTIKSTTVAASLSEKSNVVITSTAVKSIDVIPFTTAIPKVVSQTTKSTSVPPLVVSKSIFVPTVTVTTKPTVSITIPAKISTTASSTVVNVSRVLKSRNCLRRSWGCVTEEEESMPTASQPPMCASVGSLRTAATSKSKMPVTSGMSRRSTKNSNKTAVEIVNIVVSESDMVLLPSDQVGAAVVANDAAIVANDAAIMANSSTSAVMEINNTPPAADTTISLSCKSSLSSEIKCHEMDYTNEDGEIEYITVIDIANSDDGEDDSHLNATHTCATEFDTPPPSEMASSSVDHSAADLESVIAVVEADVEADVEAVEADVTNTVVEPTRNDNTTPKVSSVNNDGCEQNIRAPFSDTQPDTSCQNTEDISDMDTTLNSSCRDTVRICDMEEQLNTSRICDMDSRLDTSCKDLAARTNKARLMPGRKDQTTLSAFRKKKLRSIVRQKSKKRNTAEPEELYSDAENTQQIRRLTKLYGVGQKVVKTNDSAGTVLATTSGPFIRVRGSIDNPVSCKVVGGKEGEVGSDGAPKSKPSHDSKRSATSFKMSDSVPWICIFCRCASSYKTLGDLFGPYHCHSDKTDGTTGDCALTSSQSSPPDRKSSRSRLVSSSLMSQRGPNQQTSTGSTSTSRRRSSSSKDVPVTEVAQDAVVLSEMWTHADCAIWTSGIYVAGNRLHGLEEAAVIASHTVSGQ